jgi:hypothetical protein
MIPLHCLRRPSLRIRSCCTNGCRRPRRDPRGFELRRTATMEREKTMTMLAVLGIAIAVVVIAAAAGHRRRSSMNRRPIELGVGRKLRP